MLALARAAAVIECREQRAHGEARRAVVGVGQVRAGWPPILPTGDIEEPGDRRRHVPEACELPERTCLAHHAARDHHQIRIDLPEIFVAQAPGGHRAGRERLDDHICPPSQITHDLTGLGLGQIERDCLLVGIGGMPGDGVLLIGHVIAMSQCAPQQARPILRLDPHDRGAPVGEDLGGERGCRDPSQVCHLEPGQRTIRRCTFRQWLAG